jgi:hypothetical protein
MLNKLWAGSGGRTEARTSIKESVRVFRRACDYIATNQTPSLFESITQGFRQQNEAPLVMMEKSCGNTNQCFASMFFSSKQLLDGNHIKLHTDGSSMEQLWYNPNIVTYGLRKHVQYPIIDDITFGKYIGLRATGQVHQLAESLLAYDEEQMLPRIVFVNLAWVLYENPHLGRNKSTKEEEIEDAMNIKDHQFSIVKHTNESFQIVQGYIGSSHGNHSNRNSISNEEQTSSNDIHGGYCLSSWQSQPTADRSHGERRFASRNGFHRNEMKCFFDKLGMFTLESNFNAANYEVLFGVYHKSSSENAVWPSFSFRELEDESIIGNGERFIATQWNAFLDDQERKGIL